MQEKESVMVVWCNLKILSQNFQSVPHNHLRFLYSPTCTSTELELYKVAVD